MRKERGRGRRVPVGKKFSGMTGERAIAREGGSEEAARHVVLADTCGWASYLTLRGDLRPKNDFLSEDR